MLKTKHFFFIFFITLFISCSKDEPTSSEEKTLVSAVDIGNSELPYIKISTATAILNEPKVAGKMEIYINKKRVLNSTIGIEYRGSTSYRISDKKSFGIETRDSNGIGVDVSVLGFPAEEDWILTGDVFRASQNIIFDPTLMHHYIGYELFRNMGNYSSRSKYVEVELNGVYIGVYVLMEKLKRGPDRINIESLSSSDTDAAKITGGYILKIDKTSGSDVIGTHPLTYYDNNWDDDCRYTELNSFRSNYDINRNSITFPAYGAPYHSQKYLETYFVYEYPKPENINAGQKAYIKNYINDFETALLTDNFTTDVRTYTNYIDRKSFIDFFIINEVTGNIDGYRLSTFMHKARGGKLKMGPIWDLNIGYGTAGRVPVTDWIINYNTYITDDAWMVPFWWKRLMEDPQFRSELKIRWTELRANVLSTPNVIGLTTNTENYLTTNNAIVRNYTKWTGINVYYNNNINELKTYLTNRLAWMDSKILAF
ncbi:CotH kinase family protein [Flavobacterium sp.]|uniref:CotH kinase family protein n=1 Tax=Flavobacterium sp. TaxID=239 RepID=UPI001B51FCDE|nr:CotH kinase family protein [Flavobacterium sp.]MBP6181257.1 CotH kinase family protein [Flavobacterium sp.]